MMKNVFSNSLWGFLFLICFCNAQSVEIPIEVISGDVSQKLTIGVNTFGSDNYDAGLDVLSPPPPPSGAFDVRLRAIDPPKDYLKDIRSAAADTNIFQIRFKLSPKDTSLVLKWDNKLLGDFFSAFISDNITGELFKLDMKTVNMLDINSEPFLIKVGSLRITFIKSKANSQ